MKVSLRELNAESVKDLLDKMLFDSFGGNTLEVPCLQQEHLFLKRGAEA